MKTIKNALRKWLGIEDIEKDIGKKPKKERSQYDMINRLYFSWVGYGEPINESLRGEQERLDKEYAKIRADFEELDKKFDEMEKFLQIEYYKKDEEVQVYDWAKKEHTEGFRKAKPFEEVKKLNAPKEESEDED